MKILLRLKSPVALIFMLAFVVGCDDEGDSVVADLTQLIQIDGYDKWTSVVTGTHEYDTSYYLIIASRMTNTVGVSQHVHISIKKSVLRQAAFPISVDPADFSIRHIRYVDEPSPIITEFAVDEGLTIDNIKAGRVYGSFSAFDNQGNSISGRLLGLPFNWFCPVGGFMKCTFDASEFSTTMFSWTGGGDFIDRLDPQTFRSIVGIFTLPVDVSTLENNFVLLENNQVPVKGRFVVQFYRVDFFPELPLKPGVKYTAKILNGLKNAYNNLPFAEEKTQELEMMCTGQQLTSKLFNAGTTVDIGEDLDAGQTGSWSVRQGTVGTFANSNSPQTSFSGQRGQVYVLRWSSTTGTCRDMTVDLRPFVTDFEGNMYHEVKIGNQTWMGENLKSKLYADGDPIEWDDYSRVYYRWDAVMKGSPASSNDPSGVQGVCPNGWHVPSASEVEEMMNFVAQDGRSAYLLLTKGDCQQSIDLYGFGLDNCAIVNDFWTTTVAANEMSLMLMIRGSGYSNIVELGETYSTTSNLVRCVKD